ncbi:UNVERIFIED_CONTAM: hypothetical protein PYX00_005904 [Menopon gallinae]|uniref:SH3 domain-containing protein n=1 Tax=Menopon gallinae TaxID=328185 RepID=A0AAW2HUC6_9NEOP
MFVTQQNPVTHTVIKTIYKEGPATINLSSSLSNVSSTTREKEYLSRAEQNSAGDRSDLGHGTTFWSGSGGSRVASSITTFSESNLHSMNAHPNYEFVKPRPSYPYSSTVNADRQEALNSNSSSNESVSSRDGHDVYASNDMFRKEHYSSSDPYQEPDYYKRSGFRQESDLYGSSELYSSSGGIPKKSSRHLGIHSLPLYRPQPDNVIPFSYSSHTSKFNISRLETNLRRVRTLYACLGESDGELSFDPNQIITNVRPSLEPGWLVGTLNGKTGLIPENYVEILP